MSGPNAQKTATPDRLEKLSTKFDGDGLVSSRYLDEYKILQDKIDKIGSFQFTVKGWTVTLLLASAFATYKAEMFDPLTIVAVLIVFLCTFYRIERRQVVLSLKFGRRASEIEAALARLDRKCLRASLIKSPAPSMADVLTERTESWFDRYPVVSATLRRPRVSVALKADLPFYLLLGFTVLVGALLQNSHLRTSKKAPRDDQPVVMNFYSYGTDVGPNTSPTASATSLSPQKGLLQGAPNTNHIQSTTRP